MVKYEFPIRENSKQALSSLVRILAFQVPSGGEASQSPGFESRRLHHIFYH